jgi:hypothetical protein
MKRSVVGIAVLSCAVLAGAVVLAAQTPPPAGQTPPAAPGAQRAAGAPQPAPVNLKVLPKTWTRQQVTTLMRTFTAALGVQCTHCHVGVAGDQASMKYDADDKPEKATARKMIDMVMHINDMHLKGIGTEPAAPAAGAPPVASLGSKVTCFTCHRGEKKPLTAPAPGAGRGGI